MAEALPGAELLVLAGAGHLAMMERPELVTLRLRAFLHRAARAAYGGSASRGAR
jgi:pimeloyl-ACP methyl ester carboxylesterase